MREEIKMEYKHTPKTKTALIAAIREEIKLQGERANLNCIDTSAITNMRELFTKFRSFNGDISGWDVSNVTDMSDMFYRSSFRGDISGWNVDKVEYFLPMFKWCRIPQEHRPVRFRMKRDANAPDLNGKVRFWDDTVASFSLTGDGVLTVSGDLSCDRHSSLYSDLDGDIPVRKLIIAEGVTTIGERMFSEWRNLEEVTFPESLTEIKDSAFERCRNIARLNFPKRGLLKIGGSAFPSCPVRELHLPETLTYIGPYAFEGFKELEELVIPDSVESVGKWRVFKDCSSLKSVKLPAHLKVITDSMFAGCAKLRSVTIPEGVMELDSTFYQCASLKEISIPRSVIKIGHNTFSACTKLEKIDVAEDNPVYKSVDNCCLTKDGRTLVFGCSSSVIPEGVKVIEDFAFYMCPGLKNVTIPEGVEYIGNWSFGDCRELESVNIPRSVKEIVLCAFSGTSIKDIFIALDDPDKCPDLEEPFRGLRLNRMTVHVPEEAFYKYSRHPFFKRFLRIV